MTNDEPLHSWAGRPQLDDEESFPIRKADPLLEFKASNAQLPWDANLGLATTQQLLLELRARGDSALVGAPYTDMAADGAILSGLAGAGLKALGAETLRYRTAEGGTMEVRTLDLLKHSDRAALENVLASFAVKYGEITSSQALDVAKEYLPELEGLLVNEIAEQNRG